MGVSAGVRRLRGWERALFLGGSLCLFIGFFNAAFLLPGTVIFLYALVTDFNGLVTMRGYVEEGTFTVTLYEIAWFLFFPVMYFFYGVRAALSDPPAIAPGRASPRRIAELEADLGALPLMDGDYPTCGQPAVAGAEFCAFCGRSLRPKARVCPACATLAPPTARFCPACGDALDA